MDPDNAIFEEFFAARLKHKGLNLKKLGEITGISPGHLEEIARADFGALPSAPYAHGYLVRLGKALDFDGEEWWNRVKEDGLVRNSGPTDSLPQNRFARQSPVKLAGIIVIVMLVIIYLIVQFPRLWGTPTILILSPAGNPATSSASTVTIEGTVKNADSLYLNGEEVTIAPDGSWQKDVLLDSTNPNNFTVAARKFLRGETDVVEQIIYEAATASTNAATTTPATTSTNSAVPATTTSQ
jgi:cytoskeletal protein RodZ